MEMLALQRGVCHRWKWGYG